MQDLRYPDLREPYATALREAVQFVLSQTQSAGLIAAGSILRGRPDKSSDIDLYVIHLQPWRQRLQKWFNGVPCEIFINPPAAIESYFDEEQAGAQPITAHMLSTGFVMLDADPIVDLLIQRARNKLAQPPLSTNLRLMMARYTAATQFEDAMDVAGRDISTANMILCKAVSSALEYFFLARNRMIPRDKDLLAELAGVEPKTAAVAQQFFSSGQWEERVATAGMLMDRIIGARGFFEWESAREMLTRS
jgi:hypothetical protein